MTDFTKTALAMALEDLLTKKALSELTVKDITDRAGVNRQTFYYHFKNIHDLLKWATEMEVEQIIKECRERKLSWKEFILFLAGIVRADKKIIVNAYNSIDSRTFHCFVDIMVSPLVREMVEAKTASRTISSEDKDAIFQYLFNFFLGSFFSWIDGEDGLDDNIGLQKRIDFIEIGLDAIIASTDEGKI